MCIELLIGRIIDKKRQNCSSFQGVYILFENILLKPHILRQNVGVEISI